MTSEVYPNAKDFVILWLIASLQLPATLEPETGRSRRTWLSQICCMAQKQCEKYNCFSNEVIQALAFSVVIFSVATGCWKVKICGRSVCLKVYTFLQSCSSDFLSPVTMEPVFLGPSPICSSSPPKLEVNSHCSPSLTGNIHLGFLPYV